MRKTLLTLSLGLFFLVQAGGICWSQTTERVSVDSAGDQALGPSFAPSISGDGRYVAFESDYEGLVAGDTNTSRDIFLHDRQTLGSTTRVSIDSGGNEQSGNSFAPSISGDGRYVAFESNADLVGGDANAFTDIFIRDLSMGTTTLVSVDSVEFQPEGPSYRPSISADGRYVAFESEADLVPGDTSLFDIFIRDLSMGTTTLVSVDSSAIPIQGNDNSYSPSISGDGRYVAFESLASNLVAGDTNSKLDIFVHDRQTGTTERVSVDSSAIPIQGNDDSSSPSISGDGRYVAFESLSSNLVTGDDNGTSDIFTFERESLPPTVDSTSPTDNANGVAVGSSITATFSEPMNGSTIDTNTFTLDNGVTGTVTYDANSTTATFTPTSKLDYDTTYMATITTAAEDLGGNPMLADYIWSFTTQSEENNSSGSGSCFIATAASDWADF
jgi:Tol biopolymer transport system component